MRLLLCLFLVLCSGCAIGFRGDRSVTLKLTIMGGNSFEWTSSVNGQYAPKVVQDAPAIAPK